MKYHIAGEEDNVGVSLEKERDIVRLKVGGWIVAELLPEGTLLISACIDSNNDAGLKVDSTGHIKTTRE